MSRLFVGRVGPIPDGAGGFHLYVPLGDGEALEPFSAESDAAALQRVAQQNSGDELVCAPELEAAGRGLSYRVESYDSIAALNCANVAAGIALADRLAPAIPPELLFTFLEQAAHLWKSRARTEWHPACLFSVALKGRSLGYPANERFECVLIPSPEPQLLTFNAGAAQKFFDLAARGSSEVKEVNRRVVTFATEPHYALVALERAWQLGAVPNPITFSAGGALPTQQRTLSNLSAMLWAAAWLDPDHPEASFTKRFEDVSGTDLDIEVAPAGKIEVPTSS